MAARRVSRGQPHVVARTWGMCHLALSQTQAGEKGVQFQPFGDRHAVQEVVFTLGLSRQLTAADFAKVTAGRSIWKAELPNDGQVAAFGFQIGPEAARFDIPAPLQFNAYKRDGTIDWRLSINLDNIVVNCLSYTRWDEIWPRALRYFTSVMAVISDPNLMVVGCALQYIDAFSWAGAPGAFDLAELLRADGDLVNARIFKSDVLWHLHQGWYNPPAQEAPGSILTRINIDSVVPGPIVKIDSLLRHEYPQPQRALSAYYEKTGDLDVLFRKLHEMNKEVMNRLLSPAAAERISLNG